MHQWFEAQVKEKPDAVAVIFEDKQLTYRELNHRANQLAHYLQSLGVKPESLVGICMERSLEIVVGLLAILKAGGAYVPLDPAYPKERIAFIAEETQVAILLTQKHLVNELPQLNSRLVCIDTEWQTIARESEKNPVSEVTPETLAYVIYTSGSTGKPKGVEIPHGNISHYVQAMSKALQIDSKDIYLHTASFSFSSSVRQLMIALSQGATVVIATAERIGKPLALFELIKQHHITIIDLVPSYWRSCTEVLANLETDQRNNLLDNQLRLILAASEPLLSDIPKNWRLGFKQDVRFINMYGQTETTGIIAVYPIPDKYKDEVTIVPIGKAIANTQIYILDDDLRPVAVGEIGEMYVSGTSLTRGYLKRPDLTEKIFIPNPFSDRPGAHLYKTGDLARYLPDGNIAYVGRVDYQVKIRGKRVELGEIESIISLYPGIKQTVVMGKEDVSGNTRLIAYIVPKATSNEINQKISTRELRNYLTEKLPEYMIPSTFMTLAAFPLTATGKIDRRALPAPEQVRQEREETYVAPRDELELQLTKIWEKVLGVQPIGIRDNFFELGGNSLISIHMLTEIKKVFSKLLSPSIFVDTQTIEHLANLLRQHDHATPSRSLIRLQQGNPKKLPLFCIHAISGNVLFYQNLIYYLEPDQPCYGLQALGFDGRQAPLTSIKKMASRYIEEIQAIQPEGPYFLCGHSFGGIVAFEIAQQLNIKGHKIALLALLDAVNPHVFKAPPILLNFHNYHTFITWFNFHINNFFNLGIKKQLIYLRERFKWHLRVGKLSIFYRLYLRFWQQNFPLLNLLNIERANNKAMKNYVPQIFPGQLSLFTSSQVYLGFNHDDKLGWSELITNRIDLYNISGSHTEMMQEPNVQSLAEKFQYCLERSQKDATLLKD
ncbi:hypothetical protein NIES2101_34185 [Calothrix sp. HK-06]|nr:hypothetical protein NIES2101_34185 [Calothrix sp. HK-06]